MGGNNGRKQWAETMSGNNGRKQWAVNTAGRIGNPSCIKLRCRAMKVHVLPLAVLLLPNAGFFKSDRARFAT